MKLKLKYLYTQHIYIICYVFMYNLRSLRTGWGFFVTLTLIQELARLHWVFLLPRFKSNKCTELNTSKTNNIFLANAQVKLFSQELKELDNWQPFQHLNSNFPDYRPTMMQLFQCCRKRLIQHLSKNALKYQRKSKQTFNFQRNATFLYFSVKTD